MAAIACTVATWACSMASWAAMANSALDAEKECIDLQFVHSLFSNLNVPNFVKTSNFPILLWKTGNFFSGEVGEIPSLSSPVWASFSVLRLRAALGRS